MSSEPDAPSSDRRLKTLVLTDLCDSVALTARIGDAAAAELFRALDVRALQLLQRWNGRLIDRSDGMFLLFDVPTQGLGFALDYLDVLVEIGKERKLPLQARIGIHVGDLLFWRNDEDAVAAGAKPLDVEGVAKPTAARLMALARPNQILMSAVAEALLRANQRELGDRGADLQWKSHGRWYFKGLPTPQEVFEVGIGGRAPLRMPARSSKAWRTLPLWRRPLALAAEVALVVALAVLAWVMVRPEPAIAFGERDWVVIADFTNNTGNLVLDDALQQALRISLEQSKHVNVLSDLKVRETLQQMRLGSSQLLDRRVAKEVAIRDGARAVLIPSVMEVHGQLRVSLEALDPSTGQVVYSEYAEGRGLESALESVDKVAGAMRLRLGEAMGDFGQRSIPLPRVATGSLDALHAYAAGIDAYAEDRKDDAFAYLEQATRLDPDFSAAYLAQMRVVYSRGDFASSRELMAEAAKHRDRLTPRDSLYLDAWMSELDAVDFTDVAFKWKLLGDLYPDYHAAHDAQAYALFSLGRYAEAELAARKAAVPQNPLRGYAFRQLARILLAQNKLEEAEKWFRDAVSAPQAELDSEAAAVMGARGDFDAAQQLLAKLPETSMFSWLHRISIQIGDGDPTEALLQTAKAQKLCTTRGHVCSIFPLQQLSAQLDAGAPASAAVFEQQLKAQYDSARQASGSDRAEWAFMTAATLYLAQRSGHGGLVRNWFPRLDAMVQQIAERRAKQLMLVIEAGAELASRKESAAVDMLEAQLDGTELIQVHVLLEQAYQQRGNAVLAERERQWLSRQRGLAYAENAGTYALMARNVADVQAARQR